ncbi:MAG TPA: hypothetical protein V6C97_32905 [Oculatellaceae cyanobacterium]
MNNKRLLAITSLGFLLLSIYAVLCGNETILPSALVLLFLCLIGLISPTSSKANDFAPGKAAQSAIASFAIFVAILSVLVTLFLPAIAVAYGKTGLFDGDFVRVSINDAHELAYTTCLLLVFDIIFLIRHRRKQSLDNRAVVSRPV